MRQLLLDLYEIQKIDLGLLEHEKNRAALPDALRTLQASADRLRRQATSCTEQSHQLDVEARSLYSVLETDTRKIRKWESRLNDIRNQREYQALQRETEGQRRANRDNEAKIADLHARKEAADQQLEELQERLAQMQAEVTTEQERVDREVHVADAHIAAARASRDALVPRVPKRLFATYDAIRARRMGIGLSRISQGCCTACNIRLPPQLYIILQRGNTIEQCPSCRRVMMWDRLLEQDNEAPAAGGAVSDVALGPT